MPARIPPQVLEPLTSAQHYAPPDPRELRAQAVHRLQIGLFGLCAMLLIVGLANIIMDRARLADKADPIRDVVAADAPDKKPVSDPLADIGVMPAAEPSPTPTPTPATSPGAMPGGNTGAGTGGGPSGASPSPT
ncbi:hypothetical protein MTR62_19205, partial [Novosphingobium sp. 1949]